MYITKWTTLIITLISACYVADIKCDEITAHEHDCTEIARDDVHLLVFSTLGGGLTAVDPVTSEVRWSIEDDPAVKAPTFSESSVSPYLPDPRDGSLYQLGDMGSLKKLPYTIPQLVASAPCRSSDGILYSGKKKDTWFLIDPKTGKREKVVGFGADSKDSIGWATSRSVYLGRTQYTVLMYDSRTKDKNTKPWNVTFFDYSSHSMAPEVSNEYGYLHFTGSGSGLTVTLDRESGTFMWQTDLNSPVVAAFVLGPEGLLSVPFTTVSDGALKSIIEYARDGQQNDIKLFQSLYVGEHGHGLYALPTLIDENTKTIPSDAVRLISGPNANANPDLIHLNKLIDSANNNNNKNVVVLGHYQMPRVEEEFKLSIGSPKSSIGEIMDNGQLNGAKDSKRENHNDLIAPDLNDEHKAIQLTLNRQGTKENIIPAPIEPIQPDDAGIFAKVQFQSPKEIIAHVYRRSQIWLNDRESKILTLLVIILSGLVIAMFWYVRVVLVPEIRQQSQNGSQTMAFGGRGNGSYNELVVSEDGVNQVGKISFNPQEVLGKGCEGTFVFKGTFEERDVAVKRLLPECFTFADREVSLLRESDAHENVVRYFCTEQDRQFRYIAVELCSATVQDYTEGKISDEIRNSITMIEVLQQATNGLMHLHSLNIVHRDIKPQNVLLSFPNTSNKVRVMISDFGLCKKLNYGKNSFSRRSGVTGTEGWIAPEMLKGQRTTTAVDIFSLGCVYYYVVSNGSHPFGDVVKRQLNILSYEYDLRLFSNEDVLDNVGVLADQLIRDMIDKEPNNRPAAKDILTHPFFWNAEKVLNFLQDVSDRVEKIDFQHDPLKTLEKNSKYITRDDWNLHLDESITSDLRKYRAYQGNSVRDLLRALRNKKHHYHELTVETQNRLGAIPTQFLKYWIDRFPRLLSHSYHALHSCAREPIFSAYFPSNYAFSKPNYFYEVTEDFKPFEGGNGQKSRDSPKREYRYKPMNYPNFVMDRKPGPRPQNNGLLNMFDGSLGAFNRMNKKGSYNFHRPFNSNNNMMANNTYKVDQNDTFRNVDNSKVQEGPELLRSDGSGLEVAGKNENLQLNRPDTDTGAIVRPKEIVEKNLVENRDTDGANIVADFELRRVEKADRIEKKNAEKLEKTESQAQTKMDENRKYNDKHPGNGNKKKIKSEAAPSAAAAVSKEPTELDEDGFMKVRYRGHAHGNQNTKKSKNADHQNEHVNWIVPGRENKE